MDNSTGSNRPVAASRELLRLMGRIFANSDMYGPHHKLTIESIDKSYNLLAPILEICERINFDMADGVLLVEGEPAGTTESFINVLAKRLTDVELAGLAMLKGLTREEYGKLIEIMFTGVPVADSEGEGMRQALAEHGVEHISALTVTYRTVTEHEEVVLKNAEKAPESLIEDAKAEEGKKGVVEQIMAFLKSDGLVDGEQASKDLATMLLSDPERLARFIMEMAVVQPRKMTPSGEPESLADIVVARLNRVRHALLKEKPIASAKRKTALKKNLLLLGKDILRSVKELEPPAAPGTEIAISTAINEMLGEVEIKAIASEYAKKYASFARAEKDLVQQIKAMGEEQAVERGLGKQLSAEGISSSDWRTLLMKAAEVSAPGGVSEIIALLTKLDEMVSAGKSDPTAITDVVSQVNKVSGTLASKTGKKIENLGKQIQDYIEASEDLEEPEEPERTKRKQTLAALLVILAEILQELCQPITVMSGVIQMAAAGYLGQVNEQQKEMFQMAEESGASAKQLLDRLIVIVGVPKGLAPDRELLTAR